VTIAILTLTINLIVPINELCPPKNLTVVPI